MLDKKRKYLLLFPIFFVVFIQQVSGEPLDYFGLLPDTISWSGYTFRKVSEDGHFWYGLFLKDDDTLAVFNEGCDQRMTRSAFIPLPHKGDSMLVIEQFSGGAHCCWTYTVLDINEDSFLTVFRSSDYPVGYPVSLEDLNNNGTLEWIQHLLTFDYFLVLSHARSPLIPVVFKYNKKEGYYPANPDFKVLLLRKVHQSEQFLRNSSPIHTPLQANAPEAKTFAHLLKIVLTLYYAGEYSEATALFQKYYTASDARIILEQIHRKLKQCSIFQEIYRRYPPENPGPEISD
jgi:hypothetical protein